MSNTVVIMKLIFFKDLKLSVPKICATILLMLFAAISAEAYTLKCLPSFSISETYTNNLYFDDDENRDYDYITLISPGIMAGIEWKSLWLELSSISGSSFSSKPLLYPREMESLGLS